MSIVQFVGVDVRAETISVAVAETGPSGLIISPVPNSAAETSTRPPRVSARWVLAYAAGLNRPALPKVVGKGGPIRAQRYRGVHPAMRPSAIAPSEEFAWSSVILGNISLARSWARDGSEFTERTITCW